MFPKEVHYLSQINLSNMQFLETVKNPNKPQPRKNAAAGSMNTQL